MFNLSQQQQSALRPSFLLLLFLALTYSKSMVNRISPKKPTLFLSFSLHIWYFSCSNSTLQTFFLHIYPDIYFQSLFIHIHREISKLFLQNSPHNLQRFSLFPTFRLPFGKMNSRKLSTLLVIFVISMAVLSHVGVEATRVLPEDFAKVNHLDTYSSVYQKAKFTMSYWLERLASGPSPQGPGH